MIDIRVKLRDYTILCIFALLTIVVGVITTSRPFDVFFITSIQQTVHTIITMVWITWWALVLGFGIAGGVEAWVSSKSIATHFSEFGLKELSLASFFGFVSSSCSYSAIATAKNIFKKGANVSASLGGFMFASTNLVIELGFVIWVLLGWKFVIGNYIGGIILIIFMSLILEFIVSDEIIETARENITQQMETDPVCGMEVDPDSTEYTVFYNEQEYYFCSQSCKNSFNPEDEPENRSIYENLTSKDGWTALADKQWSEWGMLWNEIAIGFIFAGLIAGFIPSEVWTIVFAQDSLGFSAGLLWATFLGAVIGVATFVCSVGNVPFATVLWNGGLPFGGVFSYIYADLIVPPIVEAYREYYGNKFGFILSGIIFAGAIVSGTLIHIIFAITGLLPTDASIPLAEASIKLDYKAGLNLLATFAFLVLYYLHKQSQNSSNTTDHS